VDSLTVQFFGTVRGKAVGIPTDADLQKPITGQTFNVNLAHNAAAAFKATNGQHYKDRELAAGANETHDLRAFTNLLGQTAQALGTLRLFFVKHRSTSAASSISVGNSGVNALIIRGCFGATAAQLFPGEAIVLELPSAGGVTVDATHKDVKVTNDDGGDPADYDIGWFGE
jgi:hypothetical protein